MRASLEQMQIANEEHRQKQQDAEARLATLKVMLLGLSCSLCRIASLCLCKSVMQSLCRLKWRVLLCAQNWAQSSKALPPVNSKCVS